MIGATKCVYLLTLAVWIGSIVFLSLIVAPTVFRQLSSGDAAKFMRALFPRYYLLGIVCAATGIVFVALLIAEGQFARVPAIVSLLLLFGMALVNGWLRFVVAPRLNLLRQQRDAATEAEQKADAAQEKEWRKLHALSVRCNVGVLAAGCALLALFVFAGGV
jgi:uncharacterized membrane protein